MKKVQLDTLSGDEVKALLEQIVEDQRIDTIPELFAFLSGVPEGVSLAEYIRSIAGDASQPADNSVGTEQLKDDSVMMDDLNHTVKEAMITAEDRVTADELAGFEV